ncbi:adenylosuccinate lyase [Candidatus Dojkabacteria bacterium]|jgi:adenylosuccinate lyase|uniref:Adenylosuccinate lyase n=1 Tax=Candidatus Dojkabacteria bacterium TaxID=2099670 RepID=A0A955I7N7_9BACT|nr:adenylosuccinate lyase [Candidatus Dojkabacteria bacterium]
MSEIKTPKPFSFFNSISSIDGRFRGRTENASKYFSEFATYRGRVLVEIEYLIAFLEEIGEKLETKTIKSFRKIVEDFSESDAELIWKKDEEINHDTKAIEYFLISKLGEQKLEKYKNFIHIGLTSTDIDNIGFALSLQGFLKDIYFEEIEGLLEVLKKIAKENKDLVMPARSHGQIAVPTTAGKELSYFYSRLNTQLEKLKSIKIGSKLTGAVGNHNALTFAYPDVDWIKFSKKFLNDLGLDNYTHTTQVEPYDHKVELIQAVKRINLVMTSLDQDIWRYLALGYISMKDDAGHVGSSTMPQKINPIGFEMSENYSSLSNGILDVLERRLPLNRWQRDLTDKYLLRDLGQALTMTVLATVSTRDALNQLGFNKALIANELDNHWEIIAEGIQTLLRTTDYTQPYEKLKELTRGKVVTKETYTKFIDELEVPEDFKDKLRKLSPENYIGNAVKLVDLI